MIQPAKRLAFLFPGQGAFYAGVLSRTRLAYSGVEWILGIVEAVSQRRFGRSLLKTIWNEKSSAEYLLTTDPDLLQLAIYTVSVAAFEILRTEGIEPDVLVGHSFGEIAALTCAGAFTVEQGAEIVCDRAESLAVAAPHDGCMLAVSAAPRVVRDCMEAFLANRSAGPLDARLQIAVENHDSQTVVSGFGSEVTDFIGYCVDRGFSAQRLNSPYAFHHTSLGLAAAEFSVRLLAYPAGLLKRPVYSPILGRYYQATDDLGNCLASHLTMPVKFQEGVRFLRLEGVGVYIECGALDALSKIVIRIAGPGNVKVFPAFGQEPEELSNVRRIITYFKEVHAMNANASTQVLRPDFEAFWRDRSPVIAAQIKAEFVKFLQLDPVQDPPAVAASAPAAPPVATHVISRDKLFGELVTIYAEAMEYPHEVFSEGVELEAELGIDSVKQTEIIHRISTLYRLPPLPANFRAGDFKAMGQIVDFVFAHQGEATDAAV